MTSPLEFLVLLLVSVVLPIALSNEIANGNSTNLPIQNAPVIFESSDLIEHPQLEIAIEDEVVKRFYKVLGTVSR